MVTRVKGLASDVLATQQKSTSAAKLARRLYEKQPKAERLTSSITL